MFIHMANNNYTWEYDPGWLTMENIPYRLSAVRGYLKRHGVAEADHPDVRFATERFMAMDAWPESSGWSRVYRVFLINRVGGKRLVAYIGCELPPPIQRRRR